MKRGLVLADGWLVVLHVPAAWAEANVFLGKGAEPWRKQLDSADPAVRRSAAFALGRLGAGAFEAGRDLVRRLRDPDARVREMDEQGIDVAVLYPTLGIVWEEDCTDPELSAAYTRAYNDFVIDFCSRHPDRLKPVAHVNLRDVGIAVAEVERVKDKVVGLFYTPFAGNGRSPGERYYDRFWGAAQEFQLPVSTHVQGRTTFHGHTLYAQASPWLYFMQLPGETQLSLNCVVMDGVLERFPRLRYVVLEVGCG